MLHTSFSSLDNHFSNHLNAPFRAIVMSPVSLRAPPFNIKHLKRVVGCSCGCSHHKTVAHHRLRGHLHSFHYSRASHYQCNTPVRSPQLSLRLDKLSLPVGGLCWLSFHHNNTTNYGRTSVPYGIPNRKLSYDDARYLGADTLNRAYVSTSSPRSHERLVANILRGRGG